MPAPTVPAVAAASPDPNLVLLPFDQTFNLQFIVCLGLGIAIVGLFSAKKFEESTVEKAEDDFIAQVRPRYLATHEEYSRALLRYLGSMVGILCALSILGPRLIEIISPGTSNFAPVAPLGFALIIVGVLPNAPWLQDFEWRIRRFWHERAFIPAAARAIADTLRGSNFDFANYRRPEVLASPSMRGLLPTDFDAPRSSIEYAWARLSCLSYELAWRREAGEITSLDDEMLDRYSEALDNIDARRKALEADVAQYREEKARNPFYDNDQLRNAIKNALRQLYVLLGCAVRLKASRNPSADVNAAFRPFGFILGPSAPPPSNQDLIIVGLAVAMGTLLLLTFAGCELAAVQLWQPSGHFPNNATDPFLLAFSAALLHGPAIMTADWMRSKLIRKGRWFVTVGRDRRRIAANYIRIAAGCAVVGYLVTLLWSLLFLEPSFDLAKSTAPVALLPAVTGGFFGFHLDNVELGRRPARWQEIAAQALLTAFAALVSTPAWLSLAFGEGISGNVDFILLHVLSGAAVGAALAWYLPNAAADRQCRQLQTDTTETRIKTLRTAAIERFVKEDLAEQWLSQPQPALGNVAPKEAVADADAFSKALGLLQGPVAVAA